MLACVGDHARVSEKSCESEMYDSSGASYLLCSCVAYSYGVICRGMLGVLRARIQHELTLIPLLVAAVLWLGPA
jgi:hypothetical protein